MVSHQTSTTLAICITTILTFFQFGLEVIQGSKHDCTCVYNATFPKGHCECVPPIGGGGTGPTHPGPGQPGPSDPTVHKCICTYTAEHPNGHCECDPPFDNNGGGGGGQPPIPPGKPQPSGPIECLCVKNNEHPQGKCTCDKELCFKDKSGKDICVAG